MKLAVSMQSVHTSLDNKGPMYMVDPWEAKPQSQVGYTGLSVVTGLKLISMKKNPKIGIHTENQKYRTPF